MLKRILSSLEGVDESLKGHYKKQGDSYVLDAEPDPEVAELKAKVSEFRDNNVSLKAQIEKMSGEKGNPQGFDPSMIESLVKDATKTFSEQIAALQNENKSYKSKMAETQVDDRLRDALTKAGVLAEAMPDAIRRGKEVFKLGPDLNPVALQGENPVMSKKDPTRVLSIGEWASDLKAEARHLFAQPAGAGFRGGAGVQNPSGVTANPFSQKTWNFSKQLELKNRDPQQYEALKASAET